jgi:hypothetical protein
MPEKKSAASAHSEHAPSQVAAITSRSALAHVSPRGPWCARCHNSAHWTYECLQKGERACLQEQLSCAIAACETRQVALRQRQEDDATQRELHALEMLSARNEQKKLVARIEELDQKLVSALKEERRLIDTVDKFRLELNDCRKSLKACTERCEGLEQALLEAREDKEKALVSACEAAEKRALIEAQKCDARIAQAKADADSEIKRCLKDAGKKVDQDLTETQMQLSEYAQRIDVLQSSLIEKRRELKGIEKQLADEKIAAEARVSQAVEDTESKVKMTTRVLRKEVSDAGAIVAEYKLRCDQLQMSLFQTQHDARAREAAALDAAVQQQQLIRNLQDEIEAQRALHSAEMQLADAEQAKLTLQLYELQIASAQTGRSKV